MNTVQVMDELYSSFRFSHRELFKRFGEKSVRAVFEDTWFFINELQPEMFTNGDLLFYLDFGMKERGIAVPELAALATNVAAFISEDAGIVTKGYDNYEDIFAVVAEIVPHYTDDPDKFTGLLARRIADEFKTADFEMTLEECALKLKEYPELRFLPLPLLHEAVISVYDYFMQLNEE
ncbi:MAG TPA: hypothetical protein PLI62_16920 [Spirochaetota bacterium]|nr:hypothetical protein [Spirochaetota bacterium]